MDDVNGYFDHGKNTVIGEIRVIILLDINKGEQMDLPTLIDTLTHESTHASHFHIKHRNNKILLIIRG